MLRQGAGQTRSCVSRENPMIRRLKSVLIIAALAIGPASVCSASSAGGVADGLATITSIAPDGIVTATDAGQRSLSFQVRDPAVLRALRAGQTVMVNTTTGQVSVAGNEKCCTLLPRKALTQKALPSPRLLPAPKLAPQPR
jgi:hypothetical protein